MPNGLIDTFISCAGVTDWSDTIDELMLGDCGETLMNPSYRIIPENTLFGIKEQGVK